MAKDKIDHLTEIVKLGLANLDARIERGFAATAIDIDDLDHKIMSLRATTDGGFLTVQDETQAIRREMTLIRRDLDDLKRRADNTAGLTKEIDHALERIAAIEKHLGIEKKIAA
jgi:hypothetical protein